MREQQRRTPSPPPCVVHGNNVMSVELLEASLLRVGMVLRPERDAWSMVTIIWQARNEYAPPSPPNPYGSTLISELDIQRIGFDDWWSSWIICTV